MEFVIVQTAETINLSTHVGNWIVIYESGKRCTARNPACPECPLLSICPYGRARQVTHG